MENLSRKKFRVPSIKCFMLSVILFSTYLFVYFTFITIYISHSKSSYHHIVVNNKNAINLPNVVMHLDLKGFPPKFSYLRSLLPELQELGVTGILIEYEDMFPYEGRLVNLSAKYAFNKTELQEFLKEVVNLGFDIIPLIQTFGHMEHVLKLKEFQHLRELPNYSNVICPSKSESRILIQNMLAQVIKFHQNIFPLKYFHIGSDEVYYINKCNQCTQRNQTDTNIFFKHVKATTDFVKKISPDTTVLMWDDMLRNIKINEWENINDLRVEPVYWSYGSNEKILNTALYQYHKKFENIWIASAFKGADGIVASIPDIKERFLNHLRWMVFIQNYKFGGEQHTYSFKGIILTGWSRYSHTSPPCELLPVSVPSLYLNLLLIKKFSGHDLVKSNDARNFFNENIKTDITRRLRCKQLFDIDSSNIEQCNFGSDDIYKAVILCNDITTSNSKAMKVILETHANIEQNIELYNKFVDDIRFLEDIMTKTMSRYYDKNFVTEYVNYKLNASKQMLLKFQRLNTLFV